MAGCFFPSLSISSLLFFSLLLLKLAAPPGELSEISSLIICRQGPRTGWAADEKRSDQWSGSTSLGVYSIRGAVGRCQRVERSVICHSAADGGDWRLETSRSRPLVPNCLAYE
ncbi:uncharacterized protein BDV14DRAFT_107948 [Aspergillus stella-maris]|uniref:uncharacterized protein n=1 Tax=Aspergillus stella-maris TaxID=1810926 RepID=UPI003CCDB36A